MFMPPVLLSEAGFYGDPELWELGIYDEDDLRYFPREKLPFRFWSLYASPSFFANIPPDLLAQASQQQQAAGLAQGGAAPKSESKKDKPFFRFARVKTQYCVDSDLSFCETLAVIYDRIQEDRGEKVFLRGNVFLAKIAKAIFEQNGNLFAEACGKYKNDDYFRKCADELEKLDFKIEKDGKPDKNSWLGLYEIVLLLTSEYLATKCDLPKMKASECKENDEGTETMEIIVAPESAAEEEIKEADLAILDLAKNGLYDSSDHIAAGELFHEFIAENFPFKEDENELAYFMKGIYGEETCSDLGWFCKDTANGIFPRPEIKIDAMEDEDILGDHDGEAIYINQRLVLDALRNPDAHFVLFLAMLIEYGNFLGYVLREKAGLEVGNPKLVGRAFAYRFMERSEADLFNSDFEFADFSSCSAIVSLDDKSEEQKLVVGISDLSSDQRKSVFYTLDSLNIWEEED
ncbi:MAG: hypothetical protein LBH25_12145 [Fibromonadaceae bacterium]|jgi:hypothetical protein|nr:hypothetical protein [Fibromonadaceae bacterium]